MTIVTRKTDYATRLLLYLARRPLGDWTASREIAEIQDIPQRLVGSIVSQLAKAGFVLTKRGKGGGIRLGMSPAQINLNDVVSTMQGPISLNTCVSSVDACKFADICSMKDSWARSQSLLVEQLRATTFDELAKASDSATQR